MTLEECADHYFGDMPYRILGEGELSYACDCSREKTVRTLLSLGEVDLKDIIEKDEKAELSCHFCKTHYVFEKTELKQILLEAIAADQED
jgi:molecular chaperone Hsp33